jgi:hypothetical protein
MNAMAQAGARSRSHFVTRISASIIRCVALNLAQGALPNLAGKRNPNVISRCAVLKTIINQHKKKVEALHARRKKPRYARRLQQQSNNNTGNYRSQEM